MTPYELNLHIITYADRLKREGKDGLTLAYLTAYWQRVKYMPSLKKLLEGNSVNAQTPEQMLSTLKQITAAMGGEIKVVEGGGE